MIRFLHNRVSFLRDVWREFSSHNGLLLAAAVSFYAFLSLFPLLLLVAGVLGYVLRSPVHAEALLTNTLGGLVVGPNVMLMVGDVIHGRNAATGIGLLLLLWSGMAAGVVLEQAMNVAWNSPERRSYIKRRAVALLALVVIGVLMSLSFGVTVLLQSVRASSPEYIHRLTHVWGMLGHLIAAAASVLQFAAMYKLLPYARVSLRTALVGGLFAGALWEAAKQVFTFYVVHWAAYSRVYGSLASVILLMVWINYSAAIAILGAEFASHWSAKHEQGRSV